MINGLINVYKEAGFTSMDVCAVLRGITGQRKIGHTGTLDPGAEGVLPVCLGNATKLCDMLEGPKEYEADLLLGKRTDTLDIFGTVLEEKEVTASEEEVTKAILSFVGGYEQTPPMYSAKLINGQRLYDLARKGRVVERKKVFVDIYGIEILKMELPKVSIRVKCGKGTYIRSLCEDIGTRCGELAVMTKLTRTETCGFLIKDALKIADLEKLKNEGRLAEALIPTDRVFEDLKGFTVKAEFKKYIENGNALWPEEVEEEITLQDGEKARIYNDEKKFMGLFVFSEEEKLLKPFKMFLEQE